MNINLLTLLILTVGSCHSAFLPIFLSGHSWYCGPKGFSSQNNILPSNRLVILLAGHVNIYTLH